MNLGGRNYIGIITRGRLCSVDVGAPVKLTMRLGGWTEPPRVAEASGSGVRHHNNNPDGSWGWIRLWLEMGFFDIFTRLCVGRLFETK